MNSVSLRGLKQETHSRRARKVSPPGVSAAFLKHLATEGQPMQAPARVRFAGNDSTGFSRFVNWLKQYLYQPLLNVWEKLKIGLSRPFKVLRTEKSPQKPASSGEKTVQVSTDSSSPQSTLPAPQKEDSTRFQIANSTPKPAPQIEIERPATPPIRDVQAPQDLSRQPLTIEKLFGPDLTKIRFRQREGNTCYLLASLKAIFHHPQGKQILEKIQFSENHDSYLVKFPGQLDAIRVYKQELGTLKLPGNQLGNGSETQCLGVKLIESAYSRLPNHIEIHDNDKTYTEGFGQYFSPGHCLTQLFGPEAVSLPTSEDENNLLRNAKALQTAKSDFADVWVAQKIIRNESNHPVGVEPHYQSVICHKRGTPGYFEVWDPINPESQYVGPEENILRRYLPTSVRIKLNS